MAESSWSASEQVVWRSGQAPADPVQPCRPSSVLPESGNSFNYAQAWRLAGSLDAITGTLLHRQDTFRSLADAGVEPDLATNLGVSILQLALGPDWREGSETALEVIHGDPPMPQEIANGFYPAFEERWRKAEMAGRFAMLGFVLACAAGRLGMDRSATGASR